MSNHLKIILHLLLLKFKFFEYEYFIKTNDNKVIKNNFTRIANLFMNL